MNLTNKQNDIIANIYNQKRLRNIAEHNRRTEEVYAKVPEVEEITHQIASMSIAAARRSIEGDRSLLDELPSNLAILTQDKRMALVGAGYPADYLDELYDCYKCHDTGYINGQHCDCFKKTVVGSLYIQSNLKDVLKHENFDTFSFEFYPDNIIDDTTGKTALDNIEDVVDYCHKFIKNFKNDNQSLLFYGKPGVGKTFLINCIAKELIENAFSVIYLSAIQLFDMLSDESFHKEKSSAYKSVSLLEMLSCDLLIIDDLGSETSTSFTTSSLFNCLNERLIRHKSTIISTNLELDDLAKVYTGRIFSRLTTFKLFKIYGAGDIRRKKKIATYED